MKKHATIYVIGLGALAAYSLYEALFYAWLTATPLKDDQLTRAQHRAYVYFGVAALAGLIACCVLVLKFRAVLNSRRLSKT